MTPSPTTQTLQVGSRTGGLHVLAQASAQAAAGPPRGCKSARNCSRLLVLQPQARSGGSWGAVVPLARPGGSAEAVGRPRRPCRKLSHAMRRWLAGWRTPGGLRQAGKLWFPTGGRTVAGMPAGHVRKPRQSSRHRRPAYRLMRYCAGQLPVELCLESSDERIRGPAPERCRLRKA